MHEADVEAYLHEHIPLSAAMGVRVRLATPERVELTAPLAPNINHRESVFGGSAAAVATLAAWTLLHLRLQQIGAAANLVIQRNSMSYDEPINGEFAAVSLWEDDEAWARFRTMLERRGRARMTLHSRLVYDGRIVATFEGDFVAL